MVFVKPAGIEHHHVRAAFEQRVDFVRRERRGFALRLDQLAKGFAGHVDIAEQLAATSGPTGQAIQQHAHLRVSQSFKHGHSTHGQTFAVVDQHHGCVQARNARQRIALDAAIGQVDGKQRMALRIRVFLAHIHQSDFFFLQQGLAHLQVGGDGIGMARVGLYFGRWYFHRRAWRYSDHFWCCNLDRGHALWQCSSAWRWRWLGSSSGGRRRCSSRRSSGHPQVADRWRAGPQGFFLLTEQHDIAVARDEGGAAAVFAVTVAFNLANVAAIHMDAD